jgi:hypothetical protein
MAIQFFEHLDNLNDNIIDFVLLLIHSQVESMVVLLSQFV